MSWWGALGRGRGRGPGLDIDPDLLAIFPDEETADPDLLPFAQHLLSLRDLRPGSAPDPGFRRALRASLLAEARQRRARRFDVGIKLGAGLATAGVALLAIVAVGIALFPAPTPLVLAQSRQAGSHDLRPTQAIELSFNRPMSERSVEAGLRIQPAVPYSVSWTDARHLVIRPRRALAADVSYVVTIARTAARAADGAVAARPIVIPFGTAAGRASAPGPAPGPRVTAVEELALADGAAGLLQGPGGMLYVSATGAIAPTGARAIRRLPLAGGIGAAVGTAALGGAGAPLAALGPLHSTNRTAASRPPASPTPSATPTPTVTGTPLPSPSRSPSVPTTPARPLVPALVASTPTPTPTPTPAATPTPTATPPAAITPTATPPAAITPTPPAGAATVPTPTPSTPAPGGAPTATATPTPTLATGGVPVLSAGPSPTERGTVTPPASPSGTATPRPVFRPRSPSIARPGAEVTVFRLTPDGTTAVALLRHVRAPSLSPDGTSIAGWAGGRGGSQVLEVANTAGPRAVEILVRSTLADPSCAWLDDGHLLVSTGRGLVAVGLDGHVAPVDAGVALGSEGYFLLAPSGLDLYSVPRGVPTVTNLTTLTRVLVPQLAAGPVWSPDGSRLVYVRADAGVQTLELANADGSDPTALFTDARGARIGDLAYSPQGRFVSFTSTRRGGRPELTVVDTATGAVTTLSGRPGVADPVWSPDGSAISALQLGPRRLADAVLTFRLSDVGAIGENPTDLAAAAAGSLAGAQVDGPRAHRLAARVLARTAHVPQAAIFPGHFNRDYVVTTTPAGGQGNTFAVEVELIRDATTTRPTESLPEQLMVQVSGGRAAVTSVTASVLQPVPSGPTVMHTAVVGGADGTTVFRLQFDADLDPSSLTAQGVSLTVGNTVVNSLQMAFSPLTRILTVSAGPLPAGPITLTVGAPIADVDHTPMGAPFHLTMPGTIPSLEAAPPG